MDLNLVFSVSHCLANQMMTEDLITALQIEDGTCCCDLSRAVLVPSLSLASRELLVVRVLSVLSGEQGPEVTCCRQCISMHG